MPSQKTNINSSIAILEALAKDCLKETHGLEVKLVKLGECHDDRLTGKASEDGQKWYGFDIKPSEGVKCEPISQ